MTPQERQLIDDLFDRLAKLETAPRDPEAMSAIMRGLRSAPNAVYALVQTALVQDEALKRANSRIQELEAAPNGQPNQSGGFLDTMRDAIFGQGQSQGSGSVPHVRAPDIGGRPVWNTGQAMPQNQPYGQQYGQPQYGQPQYGQPQQPPYSAQPGGPPMGAQGPYGQPPAPKDSSKVLLGVLLAIGVVMLLVVGALVVVRLGSDTKTATTNNKTSRPTGQT